MAYYGESANIARTQMPAGGSVREAAADLRSALQGAGKVPFAQGDLVAAELFFAEADQLDPEAAP